MGGERTLRERYRTIRQDCLVPVPEVPGSFQWERITIRSADERAIRRQNGFINVCGWRKEPLAKKNRTRLFVCGKTHLKNISLNVYDILLGMGGSPMKLYSSPNADTGSDNADNR